MSSTISNAVIGVGSKLAKVFLSLFTNSSFQSFMLSVFMHILSAFMFVITTVSRLFWRSVKTENTEAISNEQNDYAINVKMLLEKKGLRSIIDDRNEKINYKIREHSVSKIPILMICGAKEVQNKTITIRRLGQEQQQTMGLEEAIKELSKESRPPTI